VMGWLWPGLTTRGEYLPQKRWAWTVCLVAPAVGGSFIWFGKIYVINFYHASPEATLSQQIYYQWLALEPTLPEISAFLKAMALTFTTHTNEGVALTLFGGLGMAGLTFASARLPRAGLFLGLWLMGPLVVVIMAEFALP
jgi:hypothetical protein